MLVNMVDVTTACPRTSLTEVRMNSHFLPMNNSNKSAYPRQTNMEQPNSNVTLQIPEIAMRDISQSSINTDLRLRGNSNNSLKDPHTSGLIKPFKKPRLSFFSTFLRELKTVIVDARAKRIIILGSINSVSVIILLMWCRSTDSMALTAYTYLTVFDFLILSTCLLSVWVEQQNPTPAFTFGYERFEVLAVFASTILAQLGALFIIKESIERLLMQPTIHTGRFLLATVLAFVCHLMVTYSVNSKAWNHVVAAASSSWLQEHVADMSQSVCHFVPGLSSILLPRANPLVLIAFAGGTALFVTHLLIEMNNYHIADTFAAICIALMTCGTMFPMAAYSGKILLQTTPSHIIGQLDKCLREASTLDGVLEFRNEHFWTLSFGVLAGSLHVRIRRDANEQLVLAHLVDRLSNLVSVLTIQVFKDDWTRSTTTLHLLQDTALLTNTMPRQFPQDTPVSVRSTIPTVVDLGVSRPITTSYISHLQQSFNSSSPLGNNIASSQNSRQIINPVSSASVSRLSYQNPLSNSVLGNAANEKK